MKILLVEDESPIREGLAEILIAEGYEVVEAKNGQEGIDLFKTENPDFVCLDIMMPEKSGYDVCREIRAISEDIPIIFISAKSEEIDKVLGLELGADDYILKPFGIKEVVARVRTVSRRYFKQQRKSDTPPTEFAMGDLKVIPDELRATRDNKQIDLSLREVKILQLFQNKQGKVLSRDELLNECWGINYFPNSRTLDQTISNLRKKIEIEPSEPAIIKTVHGAGYRY